MTQQELPIPSINDMIKEDAAADMLCQSVRTLQKWRVTGTGPDFHKFGTSVRYKRSELAAWIEDRRRSHTSEDFPLNAG